MGHSHSSLIYGRSGDEGINSVTVTSLAAIALSCAVISAAGCNTDVRDGQSPWFEHGSADATDTPPEQRQVLVRSTKDGTEGVVLDDDTDIEVTDGEFQRPSADRWKPVSGLGQVQGIELMEEVGEDANVELRRLSSLRVGVVRGMVREGDRRIELRNPAFQTCRTADALDFNVVPRASDECFYIDGDAVVGRMDGENRRDDWVRSLALTVSFGGEAPERAKYECTVELEDERTAIRPAVFQFRVRLNSFRPAVVSKGSVESTCTVTNGEATSSTLRVQDITGWVSGSINSPGIKLVNIAVRLEVSGPTGENGDDEPPRTLSFWTNIDSEAVPFSVD